MKRVGTRYASPAKAANATESGAKGVITEIAELAGFVPSPEQEKLKATLLVKSREESGAPLATLVTKEAIERASGESIPAAWAGNTAFMAWIRDGEEGTAKAELLFQRCMDKALQVVSDVTLSDKDLAALLKLSAELTGRLQKGGGPLLKTPKRVGALPMDPANRDEMRKQLHQWALSEGYTPPANQELGGGDDV